MDNNDNDNRNDNDEKVDVTLTSELVFTCSTQKLKSKREALEKDEKYVQN